MSATVTHWQFLNDGEPPFRTEMSAGAAKVLTAAACSRADRDVQFRLIRDRDRQYVSLVVVTTTRGAVHDVYES